jgi:hypothetical protein
MPEASIDENHHLAAPENEIGMPRQGVMAPPAGDPMLIEKRDHTTLSLIAFVSDQGHDLWPLFLAQDVGHGGLRGGNFSFR